MPTLNEPLLDTKLAELEQLRSWSPRVVSKLESFLRSDDDWALFRANPYAFAAERGVSEDEAVDLFLLACKVGLFEMRWSLLCPGCGQAVQSFSTLKSVCAVFHCFLCSVDIETCLDDYVHIGFTVSPQIRAIPAHDRDSLTIEDLYMRYHFALEARDRSGLRFVDMMPSMAQGYGYVEPRSSRVFELDMVDGATAVFDVATNSLSSLVVDPGRSSPNPDLTLKLSAGTVNAPPILVAPGKLRLAYINDGDQRAAVVLFGKRLAVLEETQRRMNAGLPPTMTFDKFLSGRRLLTSHTFRQMFGTETIRSTDGIGVRDVSILFTDLKGSTEMYDRIGDLKAFALVNQHFERLNRAIVRWRGAVVKTIGDAVMASFETPADAVHAAREMLREIDAFNREVGDREIALKVGVHRGASIAVTLNERLDFFGQTVNVAARVQGLADAGEIYITDDVYRAPGVKELLSGFQITPREASLKGVQRAVSVYRVAAAAPP
ncbi:MAG: DUF5939 domain-containing protein [Kofleriaceae bacterium]